MSVKPKKGVDTAGLMAEILGTGLSEQEQRKANINPHVPIPEPPQSKKTAIPYGIPASKPGRPKIGRETKTMRLLPETIAKLEAEGDRWRTVLGLEDSDCTIGRVVEALTVEALLSRLSIHRIKTALKKTEWVDGICPLCNEPKNQGHKDTCVLALFPSN